MPPFCEIHQQYFQRDNSQIHTPIVCFACEEIRRQQDGLIRRQNPTAQPEPPRDDPS